MAILRGEAARAYIQSGRPYQMARGVGGQAQGLPQAQLLQPQQPRGGGLLGTLGGMAKSFITPFVEFPQKAIESLGYTAATLRGPEAALGYKPLIMKPEKWQEFQYGDPLGETIKDMLAIAATVAPTAPITSVAGRALTPLQSAIATGMVPGAVTGLAQAEWEDPMSVLGGLGMGALGGGLGGAAVYGLGRLAGRLRGARAPRVEEIVPEAPLEVPERITPAAPAVPGVEPELMPANVEEFTPIIRQSRTTSEFEKGALRAFSDKRLGLTNAQQSYFIRKQPTLARELGLVDPLPKTTLTREQIEAGIKRGTPGISEGMLGKAVKGEYEASKITDRMVQDRVNSAGRNLEEFYKATRVGAPPTRLERAMIPEERVVPQVREFRRITGPTTWEMDRLQQLSAKRQLTTADKTWIQELARSGDEVLSEPAAFLLDRVDPTWKNRFRRLGRDIKVDILTAEPTVRFPNPAENRRLYNRVIDVLEDEGEAIVSTSGTINRVDQTVGNLGRERQRLINQANYNQPRLDFAKDIQTDLNVLKIPFRGKAVDPDVAGVIRLIERQGIPVTVSEKTGEKMIAQLGAPTISGTEKQALLATIRNDIYKLTGEQLTSAKAEALRAVEKAILKDMRKNIPGYTAVNKKLAPLMEYIKRGHAKNALRRARGTTAFAGRTFLGGTLGRVLPEPVLTGGEALAARALESIGRRQLPTIGVPPALQNILGSRAMAQLGQRLLPIGQQLAPVLGAQLFTGGMGAPPPAVGGMGAPPAFGVGAGLGPIPQIPGFGADVSPAMELPTGMMAGMPGGDQSRTIALQLLQQGTEPSDVKTILEVLGLGAGDGPGELGAREKQFAQAADAASVALDMLQRGGVRTGPLATPLGKLGERITGRPTESTQYRSALSLANTAIKNAYLGGQMSLQELESLRDFLPSPTDQEAVAAQKLQTLISLLQRTIQPQMAPYDPYSMMSI